MPEKLPALLIDPLLPADWTEAAKIYRQGIATGAATFETEVPSWEEFDRRHLPFGRLAARRAGQLLGWAALSPVSTRYAYRGVAEGSLYVHADAARQGIGASLLKALVAESEAGGIWTLTAVVFAENLASRAMLRKSGFREVGYRERIAALHGVWHDTVLYERRSPTL